MDIKNNENPEAFLKPESQPSAIEDLYKQARNSVMYITRHTLSELKNLKQVPDDVKIVFYALMVLLKQKPNWETSRKCLSKLKIEEMLYFDNFQITKKSLEQCSKFTTLFDMEKMKKCNIYIPHLAIYIISIENFFRAKFSNTVIG
jgi:hypothetical protein